jgi:hypothetical protein
VDENKRYLQLTKIKEEKENNSLGYSLVFGLGTSRKVIS